MRRVPTRRPFFRVASIWLSFPSGALGADAQPAVAVLRVALPVFLSGLPEAGPPCRRSTAGGSLSNFRGATGWGLCRILRKVLQGCRLDYRRRTRLGAILSEHMPCRCRNV